MAELKEKSPSLHPATHVLTRGFDPSLSVGSARPAVFRSSTYVFSSPEAAERAFDVTSGRVKPAEGEAAPTPTKTPTPTPTSTGALTWLSEAATRALAQAVGGLLGF